MTGQNNWQYHQPFGTEGAGTVSLTHGPDVGFRDGLDARRSAFFRTPHSEYPDGYIGTIRSRRDDRLLGGVKDRVNQRNYQRGVHKGERIDQGDYHWNADMDPEAGIRRQASAVYDDYNGKFLVARQVPSNEVTVHLASEGKFVFRGVEPAHRGAGGLMEMNRGRVEKLKHLATPYRSGI